MLKRTLKWSRNRSAAIAQRAGFGIRQRSPYTNVYHCCVQKTASQWFKGVFRDPEFFRYSGLRTRAFPQVALRGSADLPVTLPKRVLATHLYVDHKTYDSLEKPAAYRTVFVTRDPRDIVVSFYYSSKFSHPDIAYISEVRGELDNLDEQQGLRYCIDFLERLGVFAAQRSWVDKTSPSVCIYTFEALAHDHQLFLRELFEFIGIRMPEQKLVALAGRHTFSAKANGRKLGEEDQRSHYRKGQPGDWMTHFSAETLGYYYERTGDLTQTLGYSA